MKNVKWNLSMIIAVITTLLTVVVNIFGYFKLPDKVATKFSITGNLNNMVSKPVYLILTFLLIVVISILSVSKAEEKDQRMKYIVVSIIVTVANIAMIAVQI